MENLVKEIYAFISDENAKATKTNLTLSGISPEYYAEIRQYISEQNCKSFEIDFDKLNRKVIITKKDK